MVEEDGQKRASGKTNTLLDTSSEEDDDGPQAITADFVQTNQLASKTFQSKIPQTMALPKGQVNQTDLMNDIYSLEGQELVTASHQLPKGKLKMIH